MKPPKTRRRRGAPGGHRPDAPSREKSPEQRLTLRCIAHLLAIGAVRAASTEGAERPEENDDE